MYASSHMFTVHTFAFVEYSHAFVHLTAHTYIKNNGKYFSIHLPVFYLKVEKIASTVHLLENL